MDATRATRRFRDELLRRERFRIFAGDADTVFDGIAARLRNNWYAPEFQFAASGNLLPEIARLKQELSTLAEPNDAGWGLIFWVFQPHAHLSDNAPAEVFSTDPERVIVAAHRDCIGVPYEGT